NDVLVSLQSLPRVLDPHCGIETNPRRAAQVSEAPTPRSGMELEGVGATAAAVALPGNPAAAPPSAAAPPRGPLRVTPAAPGGPAGGARGGRARRRGQPRRRPAPGRRTAAAAPRTA